MPFDQHHTTLCRDHSPPLLNPAFLYTLYTHPIKEQMNKTTIVALCTFLLLYSFAADAQITKGNWMMGGDADFSIRKERGAGKVNKTLFDIQPGAGYFFVDKFAVGLKLGYANGTSRTIGDNTYSEGKDIKYTLGPFARYYFLHSDNPFNILADIGYRYGIRRGRGGSPTSTTAWSRYGTHMFAFGAGTVLFLNSCVGLEFLLGYSTEKVVHYRGSDGSFLFNAGLQIHLEKDDR